MRILNERIWPEGRPITLGVLRQNTAGHAFWKALGFEEYAIELEMTSSARAAGAGTATKSGQDRDGDDGMR
jgi:hypothetical protein